MLGSLKETVEKDHQMLLKFFNSQPGIYDLLDAMIISARGLILKTLENFPEGECSFTRYMLWATMYEYIEQSLLLILKTRLDEGYALLRMASELSRDVARIGESQSNFDMWKERARLHMKDEYKNAFRFKKDDKIEKFVYDLYNMTSIYGVHSHQTRDCHLSQIGEVVHGRFMRVKVPERAVLDRLNLWLFSYFPLHLMPALTFKKIYSAINPNPLVFFQETWDKFSPIFMDIKKNMKKHYPKQT